VVVAAAALAGAAPASAFTEPELFVRMQTWDTHEAAGDWIPLASSPVLNYVGGYQIGFRLQSSGAPNEFQRVALRVASVPDGQPTQPLNSDPFCVGRAGAVGEIVEAGPELQFEGSGGYAVTVSVGPGSGGPGDCLAGPSTTASFSVDAPVAPSVAGEPLSFRAEPLAGDPFVGVQAPAPPGGEADVRCALDATVQPDGSVTGSEVVPDPELSLPTISELEFPRPGVWACVARGTAEGLDDNLEPAFFATPWSAPLPVDVRSDFRRRTGRISRPRARRPRLSLTAEWPDVAQGGRASVKLLRVRGCRGERYRLRRVATYEGQFGPERMRLRVRRPRAGYYIGRVSFAGTRFVRASRDPNLMLLLVQRGRIGFVTPFEFPPCSG
jgi:hypothetical protein